MSAKSSARKAAKYAKQTRNAARVTAVATVVSARDQRKQMRIDQAMAAQSQIQPGWYIDPYDPRCITWHDGFRWLPESKRLAPPQGQSAIDR